MTRLRRAFVAVVPPTEVLEAVESVVAPVRSLAPPRLKWTHAGQWHLTLQFLGPIAENVVDGLVDSLRATLHGEAPVALALGGAGAFPSASRASVLWIGLDEGQVELARLADAVARATAPFGYTADHAEFTAHVTVARTARARPLADLIASLGEGPVGPVWDVTHAVLMESDTRSEGAVYGEVERFALAG